VYRVRALQQVSGMSIVTMRAHPLDRKSVVTGQRRFNPFSEQSLRDAMYNFSGWQFVEW
jgi:hypothetical protein